MTTSALAALATHAGLQTQWQDAWGAPQSLTPEAVRTVLECMGLPCATTDQCEASRAWLAADDAAHALPPLVTADQGRPVCVPWQHALEQRPYRLELEDGGIVEGIAHRRDAGILELDPIHVAGYHHLLLGDASTTIAVAPPRCYGVADALAASSRAVHSRKPWGLAVQLYALRRGAETGLGDLTTLAHACEAAAYEQADAVAINPLHAGFAALPERYSPYSPSSRLFLNPLYADPAAVFGEAAVAHACTALGLAGTFAAAEACREIDWPTLAPARYALLRWLWERRDKLLPAEAMQQFQAFRARGGNALHAHACFEAMQAARVAASATPEERHAASDWRLWPESWRDPSSPAATLVAAEYADPVSYHTFLQWLAAQGLEAAQHRACAAGMAIGVIADLAVGTDPGGSHAWTRQAEMLNGFHAGAPPDVYNPLGQDWGVAVFSPRGLRRHGYAAFIEMLRANLAHAGGLRIDHVLGLARMWLVPEGASARDGAYLTYPLDDLLRLVALESWRHRAIIIGENLGTVPPALNTALSARGVLGIDVLWFEREAHGAGDAAPAFVPAPQWPPEAVATTTTHDLPTLAGWWAGRDIAWRARLGQLGMNETEAGAMAVRAADRAALWQTLVDAGLVEGPEDDTVPIDAILAWLGRTSTPLRLVPVEDLMGLDEQPNLPGTIEGHPNWQRRVDGDVRALFAEASVRARVAALRGALSPTLSRARERGPTTSI